MATDIANIIKFNIIIHDISAKQLNYVVDGYNFSAYLVRVQRTRRKSSKSEDVERVPGSI